MTTVTIGMDLGDRKHQICVLDEAAGKVAEVTLDNTATALRKYFRKYAGALVAMETGTHSQWISRLLVSLGCRVLVGNSRKLRAIWNSPNKSDLHDAAMLARIARFDPQLLYPVQHRSEQAHADLERIKARDALVRCRRSLINHVRGAVKAFGVRLPACSAESFAGRVKEHVPKILCEAITPLLETIGRLTEQIRDYDRQGVAISRERYAGSERLQQVSGVGPLTALAYVLTLEEPDRFDKSRSVGPYLGLTPKRDQSGQTDKQLHITRAGNRYLRQLLVTSSHYILGPFGPDSDLRRYGLRIAERGGKNAKKRAVVAVARKLSVLLHYLWKTGVDYVPLHTAGSPQT
jgi:transposase